MKFFKDMQNKEKKMMNLHVLSPRFSNYQHFAKPVSSSPIAPSKKNIFGGRSLSKQNPHIILFHLIILHHGPGIAILKWNIK